MDRLRKSLLSGRFLSIRMDGMWDAVVTEEDGSTFNFRLHKPHPQTPRRNKRLRLEAITACRKMISEIKPINGCLSIDGSGAEVVVQLGSWVDGDCSVVVSETTVSASCGVLVSGGLMIQTEGAVAVEGEMSAACTLSGDWSLEGRRISKGQMGVLLQGEAKLTILPPRAILRGRVGQQISAQVTTPEPTIRLSLRIKAGIRESLPKPVVKRLGPISSRTGGKVGQLVKPRRRSSPS